MRTTTILRYIGLSMVAESIAMFISAAIAFLNGMDDSFNPLLMSGILTLIVGSYPLIFVSPKPGIYVKEGYVILAGTWLAACMFGSFPYLFYGPEMSFTDALFESVSAFTTTGASVITDVESLPMGLQFWRIISAWIGGIGIVTLLSLVVSARVDQKSILNNIEGSSINESIYGASRKKSIFTVLLTYFIITAASCISLKVAGMGWFDAAEHAMSACSTCGFSTRGTSLAYYHNHAIEMILCISMILGAINFTVVFETIGLNRQKNIFKSEIVRIFLGLLLACTVVITISLVTSGKEKDITEAFMMALFQVCSLATTTGFATADTNTWPSLCIIILVGCSIICGCSGSTSGGIKIDRLVILAKDIKDKITSLIHPNKVTCIRIGGKFISDSARSAVSQYVMLYICLIGIGALINSAGGLDIITSISSSVACMGNVGPGFGAVGSMDNYADIPSLLKYNSMIQMLLGRLEIYPIFAAVVTLANGRIPFIGKINWF